MDNSKGDNLRILRIPEKEKWRECLVEEITKSSPSFQWEHLHRIKRPRVQNKWMPTEQHQIRHIVIKLIKTKDRHRPNETSREKEKPKSTREII